MIVGSRKGKGRGKERKGKEPTGYFLSFFFPPQQVNLRGKERQ